MDGKQKIAIIIPTYNEVQNIENLIAEVLRFQPESVVLIVDDNSPDGTGRIVDILSERTDKIAVLHRVQKGGLGAAYRDGFKYALSQEKGYSRIVQMDADFSHQPKYLIDLLKTAEDKDFSIGSRYTPGGKILDWGGARRLLSSLANTFVRFWLGIKVRDCTSGFRCFRRDVLEDLGLETIKSKGYLFQIELLYRCLKRGYSFKEVPITFVERKQGKTKLGLKDVWEAFWGVLRLRFFKGMQPRVSDRWEQESRQKVEAYQ